MLVPVAIALNASSETNEINEYNETFPTSWDHDNIGMYFFLRTDIQESTSLFAPPPGSGDAAVRRAGAAPGMRPIDPPAL